MQLNPHLVFDGRCEAAFRFYEKCLGGKIETMITHEGAPVADKVSAEWRRKILHARMAIGNQVVMGMDAPPDRYRKPQGFFVSLDVREPAEAERIFQGLSEAGSVQMPLQQTFWAALFGMVVDQFGTPWMVTCSQAG